MINNLANSLKQAPDFDVSMPENCHFPSFRRKPESIIESPPKLDRAQPEFFLEQVNKWMPVRGPA